LSQHIPNQQGNRQHRPMIDHLHHYHFLEVVDRADPTATKWRRVGYVSGTSVHLDTIVWPGGDIVVSGTKVLTQSNNLN